MGDSLDREIIDGVESEGNGKAVRCQDLPGDGGLAKVQVKILILVLGQMREQGDGGFGGAVPVVDPVSGAESVQEPHHDGGI